MKEIFKIILLILIFAFNIYGVYEKGGVLVPGAKSSAMGSAFCAYEDLSSIYYNPAGIYHIKNFEFSGFYGGIVNIKRNVLGAIILNNFSPYLTAALSGLSYLNGDNTREDIYSLTFSFPILIDKEKELGTGINLKYLYALYDGNAYALSADIGVIYKIKNTLLADSINFGLSIFDMQSSIRWKNGIEEKIPLLIKSGIGYISNDLFNLTCDIDIINDKKFINNYKTMIKFGLEKKINFISLRIGYSGFTTVLSSLTFGFGILTKNYEINYSFLNHTEELGVTHKIDLKISLFYDNYLSPINVKIFSGDKKAYIKWVSNFGKPDIYRVYIKSKSGENIIKEKNAKSSEANFLIENLENGLEYTIEIYAVYNGIEKETSGKIEITPKQMDSKIKLFYKNAQMMYISGKYKEALNDLKEAEKIDNKNADIIILKEKIEKLLNMENKK